MDRPRIYVDFNDMVNENVVLLSKEDTILDSAGNNIVLKEGLYVSIYSDDIDENNVMDNLVAEGTVIQVDLTNYYPSWQHVKWCCRISENGIKHDSDLI